MSTVFNTDSLRQVNPDDLVVGTALPGALRDHEGQTLVPGGEVLTAQRLALLRSSRLGIYAGGDWPQHESQESEAQTTPQDPQQVLEALRRRHRQHGAPKPRRHERQRWSAPLRLVIVEETPEGRRGRALVVTTGDISASGLAFFHCHYLPPGSIVYARFDSLPGKPYVTAIVRNCELVEGRRHRIGAEFVKVTRVGKGNSSDAAV